MPVPPLHIEGRKSRSQALYEHLRRAIHDGTLRPGERLVEESLAAAAGVSRTPVRETLRRLEAEGLVEEANRGIVVTSLSDADLLELCAVREVLEGMAASLAAQSRSDFEAKTLEQVLGRMRSHTEQEDVEALVALNRIFHETIWKASKNRLLARKLSDLRGMIERMHDPALASMERRHASLLEHQRIVEAVAAGDPARAEEVTREHFQNAEAFRAAQGLLTQRLP